MVNVVQYYYSTSTRAHDDVNKIMSSCVLAQIAIISVKIATFWLGQKKIGINDKKENMMKHHC